MSNDIATRGWFDRIVACSNGEAAVEEGFKSFNPAGPHLCVDLPDDMSTISVRTSQDKRVTFAFMPYEKGAAPQSLDIDRDDDASAPTWRNGGEDMPQFRVMTMAKGARSFAEVGLCCILLDEDYDHSDE